MIHSNRRLFAQLASLSDERRELAQMLIATRESTLREIARELHDEFGQILTAIGSMLGRAGKHAPEGSELRSDLREIREVAQTALDNVRGLSQTLHPSILEELGLEGVVRVGPGEVGDVLPLNDEGAVRGGHDRLVVDAAGGGVARRVQVVPEGGDAGVGGRRRGQRLAGAAAGAP